MPEHNPSNAFCSLFIEFPEAVWYIIFKQTDWSWKDEVIFLADFYNIVHLRAENAARFIMFTQESYVFSPLRRYILAVPYIGLATLYFELQN